LSGLIESGPILGATSGGRPARSPAPIEVRILAERVKLLYDRALISQATVVVNAVIVTGVFWGTTPPERSLAWTATLCLLAALRMALVVAARRGDRVSRDPRAWAHRFAAGSAITGVAWGAAALVFHAPNSSAHQVFLAFVLGGMTAGAASSNASYLPAFLAFAAPALLPMVVRLGLAADSIGVAMAFMLALFGASVGGIAARGSRTLERAIALRFRNEALLDGLTAAEARLAALNAGLERRVEDRTAELQRVLALRASSEARLAAILCSVEDAVIATDPAGTVTLFNRGAEALTGWKADEAASRPLKEVLTLVDASTGQPADPPLELVLAERAIVSCEGQLLVARDGSERPIGGTFAPLRQGDGPTEGVVLALRDRTAEWRAEEALRDADRRKDHFIAVLSHELRSPLSSIRNGLQVIERAAPNSPAYQRALAVSRRQIDQLSRLTDDLFEVTRVSRGKIQLRRARISARDVARRAAEDHRAAFHQRALRLRVEVSDDLSWIDADEARMAQVIGNLLQNALKFSRRGGVVTLRVDSAGEQVRISVADEGMGISPDLLPRMFEPFVQGDGGAARVAGGLGLGLALVRELVDLHGGTVSAHSAGPGRGSEFVVTLPHAAPADTEPAPAP
jgi:PAS domain S-box-containing protein